MPLIWESINLLFSNKRNYAFIGALSCFFALSFTFVEYLNGNWDLMKCFAIAVPFGVILFLFFALLVVLINLFTYRKHHKKKPLSSRQVFLVSIMVIWVFGFVNLLMHYPGFASVDSNDILREILGLSSETYAFRYESLSNHHPILYVALVSIFIKLGTVLGNLSIGVALYSIFQMTIMAVICSFSLKRLYEHTGSIPLTVFGLVFFALNPVILAYSITMWKDILFAEIMLLFIILLIDIVKTNGKVFEKKLFILGFFIIALLLALFRSNAFLVVVAVLICLLITFKSYRKTVSLCLIGVLFSFLIIQAPLLSLLGVLPAHFSETIGVPLQQVARTVVDEGDISDEQKEFIENIIPYETIKDRYVPYTANEIKFSKNFNDEFLNSHKGEFIVLWLQMLSKNPESYLRAWGEVTIGFWNPQIDDRWIVKDTSYEVVKDAETTRINLFSDVLEANLPVFESKDAETMESVSQILYPLFNVGCMVWFLMFVVTAQACSSRWRNILILSPLVLLWLTYLVASPVYCEFRYMFSLHLAIPLVFGLLFYPVKESANNIKKQTNRLS